MLAESSSEPESFIAPSSIARQLDVPLSSVRRWIERGDLPAVHIDHAVRVPIRDYRDWLRKVTTA